MIPTSKSRVINSEELNKMVNDHHLFLSESVEYWQSKKANFSDSSISDQDLSYKNLNRAIFSNTELKNMNFKYSTLKYVDFSGAIINDCDFSNTDLTHTNFDGAKITSCNFSNAILEESQFFNSYIRCSNFADSNLHDTSFKNTVSYQSVFSKADFTTSHFRHTRFYSSIMKEAKFDNTHIDFTEFDFSCLNCSSFNKADIKFVTFDLAELYDVDFKDIEIKNVSFSKSYGLEFIKNFPNVPMICPEVGSFVGYKFALSGNFIKIIKLSIPSSAKRLSVVSSRECRCDKAKVLAIEDIDGTEAKETNVHSWYNPGFIYELGKTVKADSFSDNRFNDYTNGIHFYMSKQEAIQEAFKTGM